jgi:hypothetical protein
MDQARRAKGISQHTRQTILSTPIKVLVDTSRRLIQSSLVEELPIYQSNRAVYEVICIHTQSVCRTSPSDGFLAAEVGVGTLCICRCDTAVAVEAGIRGGDERAGCHEQRGAVGEQHPRRDLSEETVQFAWCSSVSQVDKTRIEE